MLKEIAVSAISMAKDINGTIYIIIDYRVRIFPFNLSKCDIIDTLLPHGAAEVSFQPAQPTNYSRLEIPHTNYVVQSNTVPNNNKIANMHIYMIPFKVNKKLIMC